MIIKNHTIELNDTSASEMARFRQIMLNIWRQQIEDDRNAKIMVDSFKSSQITNTAYFISIVEIIDCIKRNIGQLYPKMLFSDFVGLPNSTPEKTGIMFYNDSQGTQKTGAIHLEWNYFLGLNLIPKTFKPNIKIGKYHTEFTLAIFDHNLEKIAFKFIVYDFDHFLALLDSLGVVITSDEQIIIDLYRKKIKEANDNPNKLDVIYESLPKTLFGKMDDDELYAHLNLILKDNSLFEGMTALTDFDTNEDKAVLQILYAIKDRQKLYLKLRDTDLLYEIYSKLHGEEVQDLLRFLTRLVSEFDNTKPTETVYFDNSYYLFRDTHIKTEWSGKTIILNNYKDATQLAGKPREAYNPKELDRMYPPGVSQVYIPKYYILNRPFNPLAKLNFGTKLGELGEQVGDDNTFVIALKIHNMSTKQSNWDLFNVATDLLSLLSVYGALRVVLAKGAPLAARALAGLVLAKDTAHYAMLSNDTLQKLHDNGYGWLANLWIGFSVTVDLFSFGLPNISKIAREGNAAAELAETVEDAKEIKRVTDEANKLVKAETGKDVSKMSEKEFEKFVNETPVLLETKQKVERIAAHKKYSDKFEEKFHEHFDGELKLERASRRDGTQVLRGTGGHNNAVIGENVIIRRYLTQPTEDMPFDALISVRYSNGQWIDKTAKSTMFPKNWNITRVKEEISLIYSKKVKFGDETNLLFENNKFNGKASSGNFEILIEVDRQGNITNAYPY